MTYFDSASSIENVFDDQSNDEDFLIALQLQNQFEQENNDQSLKKITQVGSSLFVILRKSIDEYLDSSNECCG